MRVLHAGDGYAYLTRTVAAGDHRRQAADSLVDYYTATGDPPGVWAGSGIEALGVQGEVTEEHMLALFGEGLHPLANEQIAAQVAQGVRVRDAIKASQLGRRMATYGQDSPLVAAVLSAYDSFATEHQRRPSVTERHDIKTRVAIKLLHERDPAGPVPSDRAARKYLEDELGRVRQPVSGFDLVFTPRKSVSLLWALGGHAVRAEIQRAHEQAWRSAIAYAEKEAAFTRTGAGGVAQVETTGLVVVAFEHKDSRSGDPNLHTHVVVANRVYSDKDEKWRTLDGQQLFRVAVSISEHYNAMLAELLTERLNVRWTERVDKPGVYEITGVPMEWITGFSKRRTQVETGYDRLLRDYVARFGHTPPRSVQLGMYQQAALGPDRPDKHQDARPLSERIADWEQQARRLYPEVDPREVIAACLAFEPARHSSTPADLKKVAATAICEISDKRSTWTVYHVRAEAQRQFAGIPFGSVVERGRAVEAVVDLALRGESLLLDAPGAPPPALLRRSSGESVFDRHGSARYTSEALLACEQRLLSDTTQQRGPIVTPHQCAVALRAFTRENRKKLNAGQRALIEHFVSSGVALAVGIGPPGTGKSTAMRAMRTAWETTGGRVIGLAPSAAAASVLDEELNGGQPPESGQRPRQKANTLHSLIKAYQRGVNLDIRRGDMVLVDEAGMAGTRTLDLVREIAEQHSAVLRLVGDYRQLSAIEAGGALRLLHHDAGGAELTEVLRFADPHEAQALLQFRVGDAQAIPFYTRNRRLTGGIKPAVLDQLYRDWQHDLSSNTNSIMISDSSEVAHELSTRAQLDRRARGVVATTGVHIKDGAIAGVGDRVVTRLNKRRWTVQRGKDFVKNGDLWTVSKVHTDGGLTVRHLRHRGTVRLSPSYTRDYVELGYASTVHRAQGLTVEVSRSFLSPAASREAALVALSRGVNGNFAYLDTEEALAIDEPTLLPGELFYRHRNTDPAAVALETILRREGTQRSATEELRDALDAPYRLDNAVPRYRHALLISRGAVGMELAAEWVRAGMPEHAEDILADEAWPALAATLHEAHDVGADPARLLSTRAAQRALTNDPEDPARSVAQVMHYRLSAHIPTPQSHPRRPELLPGWIPTPPDPDDLVASDHADDVELATWLGDRAQDIAVRVHELGERIADDPPIWAAQLGPVPEDEAGREWWIARAGHIGAYRERWCIPDDVLELIPGPGVGERARAYGWLSAYLLRTSTPPAQRADRSKHASTARRRAARAGRQRVQLSALRQRLGQNAGADGGTSSPPLNDIGPTPPDPAARGPGI